VCQNRLAAVTPVVSVIRSPPVPRLTSNLGKAEDLTCDSFGGLGG